MSSQPRKLQPYGISLYESLDIEFFEALFLKFKHKLNGRLAPRLPLFLREGGLLWLFFLGLDLQLKNAC